jgi:hypothetical protein
VVAQPQFIWLSVKLKLDLTLPTVRMDDGAKTEYPDLSEGVLHPRCVGDLTLLRCTDLRLDRISELAAHFFFFSLPDAIYHHWAIDDV